MKRSERETSVWVIGLEQEARICARSNCLVLNFSRNVVHESQVLDYHIGHPVTIGCNGSVCYSDNITAVTASFCVGKMHTVESITTTS